MTAPSRRMTQAEICREERARLVRIAIERGAGVALAAIGFVRCKERHPDTDQRCLLGVGHGTALGPDAAYLTHQSESVTWLTPRLVSREEELG